MRRRIASSRTARTGRNLSGASRRRQREDAPNDEQDEWARAAIVALARARAQTQFGAAAAAAAERSGAILSRLLRKVFGRRNFGPMRRAPLCCAEGAAAAAHGEAIMPSGNPKPLRCCSGAQLAAPIMHWPRAAHRGAAAKMAAAEDDDDDDVDSLATTTTDREAYRARPAA